MHLIFIPRSAFILPSEVKKCCKRGAYQSVLARRIMRPAAHKVSCFKGSKLANSRQDEAFFMIDRAFFFLCGIEEDVDAGHKG